MMQATEPRHRNDSAIWACTSCDGTSLWSLLVQREVRPVVMVVVDVLGHEALEMPLVQNDDMIAGDSVFFVRPDTSSGWTYRNFQKLR